MVLLLTHISTKAGMRMQGVVGSSLGACRLRLTRLQRHPRLDNPPPTLPLCWGHAAGATMMT